MIKADLHTHTDYSHAANSVEEMIKEAHDLSFNYFGISEHSPRPKGYTYLQDYQKKLTTSFPEYISKLENYRSTEQNGLQVLMGLEADYIPAEKEFIRQTVNEHNYDYIIGGLHFQGHWGFDGPEDEWSTKTESDLFKIYEQYYLDMKDMSQSGLIHIIAHPDLIKIHTIDSFNRWIATPKANSIIKTTLQSIKEMDQILEVSSAGLRKPCREFYPGPELMRIASDLGLKICLSSDAHCTQHIGNSFEELTSYVKNFGYKMSYIVVNKKHLALGL